MNEIESSQVDFEKENDKVEEMLFHEMIFNLLTELNSNKELTQLCMIKFLSHIVRDGSDMKQNKNNLREYFGNKNLYDHQKEESIEFICKYVLKKTLRLKNKNKIKNLKESTKSKNNSLDELSPLTFQPKISQNSKKIDKCKGSFKERLRIIEQKEKAKNTKLENIRKQKEFDEIRKCTFSPTINKMNRAKSTYTFERLHREHEVKSKIRKEKIEKNKTQKNIDEINQCTFHPKINSNISTHGMTHNHSR